MRIRRSVPAASSVLAVAVVGPALLAVACSSTVDPGLVATVSSSGVTAATRTTDADTWKTDRGYRVTVSRFDVAATSLELAPCAASTAGLGERVRRLVEGTALAHSEGSPTLSGVPVVESLTGGPAKVPTSLATFAPPPGRYCGVVYHGGPADADARGMPADGAMTGRSLTVVGTYQKDGAPAAEPFTLTSGVAFDASLALDGVALEAGGRRTLAVVVVRTTDALFDGIDFAAASADDEARTVLANLRASMGAAVQGATP